MTDHPTRSRGIVGIYAGLLLTVVGSIAWITGQPAIFPSLGPSAFLLATDPPIDTPRARRIIGGHLIGALAGFLAWGTVAAGIPITAPPPPLSGAGLRLGASAVLSIVLTTWGMIITDTVHPPACATTLIVSLGLLATPIDVLIIVGSVIGLVATHTGLTRHVAAHTALPGG